MSSYVVLELNYYLFIYLFYVSVAMRAARSRCWAEFHRRLLDSFGKCFKELRPIPVHGTTNGLMDNNAVFEQNGYQKGKQNFAVLVLFELLRIITGSYNTILAANLRFKKLSKSISG